MFPNITNTNELNRTLIDVYTKEQKFKLTALNDVLKEYNTYTSTLLEIERKRSKDVQNKDKIMFKVTTYR
jgi:DNA repair ATPase RecN